MLIFYNNSLRNSSFKTLKNDRIKIFFCNQFSNLFIANNLNLPKVINHFVTFFAIKMYLNMSHCNINVNFSLGSFKSKSKIF